MARVTSSIQKRKRHKKILKAAKGYYGHKSIGFKSAKEQVRKSNEYAFRDRKQIKRDFRKLWIKRINAAARINNISYSKLINGLNLSNIKLNRKMLAHIALNDFDHFSELTEIAKKALVNNLNNKENKPLKSNTKNTTLKSIDDKKLTISKKENKPLKSNTKNTTLKSIDDKKLTISKKENKPLKSNTKKKTKN